MEEEQKKVYMAYLKEVQNNLKKDIENDGFKKSQIKILAYLTRLRQICCHPGTFIENYTGGSGKLELLKEILTDALDAGHKILLFSQFTSMLGIIKKLLEEENISYAYLDGSVKAENRRSMVENFNAGPTQVFLISLKAGGTGLNLTGADVVIHFDPWWNPAVEDQATDRAYRIGQYNTVQVFKLIAHGTIEEKIYQLQQRKKEMINSIIEPGETMLNKLSEMEIKDLFQT
ncbi:MAG: helicase, partial [Vallitaleaceae bacterium]|nr:helicase [Vallitaleaceae bacterium]